MKKLHSILLAFTMLGFFLLSVEKLAHADTPDIFEPDDVWNYASEIYGMDKQDHTIHHEYDADWIKIVLPSSFPKGTFLEFYTTTLQYFNILRYNSSTGQYFDPFTGQLILDPFYQNPSNYLKIDLSEFEAGTYYYRITGEPYPWSIGGYVIKYFEVSGEPLGYIIGTITDGISLNPIQDVSIKLTDSLMGGPDFIIEGNSLPNGTYILGVGKDTWKIEFSIDDYESYNTIVTIPSPGSYTTIDVSLMPVYYNPPILISAVDNQNVTSSQLLWSPVDKAFGYQLDIDGTIIDITSGTQTSYTHTLNYGSHYWRIRTKSKAGYYGDWSEYEYFNYIEPAVETTWYFDGDGDGYGNPNISYQSSTQQTGNVEDNTDCNDYDPFIHPGAVEICGDEIDQNCDGADKVCEKGASLMPSCSISATQETNKPIQFFINNKTDDLNLNYRFSCHPNYGTEGYDGKQWESMTSSEWTTDSSLAYTFTDKGKYVVVVWAAEDTNNVDPKGIPIVGWSVNVNDESCKTNFVGYDISGEKATNSPIKFTVNATNSCTTNLYYRFSMHPYYGTDDYDGKKWQSMTDTEWVSSNSIDYTFKKSGKYVIVIWVTDDASNVDPSDVPIIGWSVDIE